MMNWRSIIGVSATAVFGISLLAGSAVGQQRSLKEQLLGTWTLVSHESVRPDGSRFPVYGANPKGIAFFDAGGQFIITVMRSDRAKYATNNPAQGTAEENKATAQGTITYFGTYSVSDTDRTIAIRIEASSFPNWNGADQTRSFAITGEQLTLTARALPTGGHADVVWTRAK
jgi:Lipocalin-like domain